MIKKLLVVLALQCGLTAPAETLSRNSVPLVVGLAPGGLTHKVALAVQPALSAAIGRTVVIEFRPGAGGNVAMQWVSQNRSPTYYVGPVQPNGTVDQLNELQPVVSLGANSTLFIARPDVKVKTLSDLLHNSDYKTLTMGYPNGSAYENYVKKLASRTRNIEITMVPFKNGIDVVTAVIGGFIDVGVASGIYAELIREKNLVPLANLNHYRSATLFPEVSTVIEQSQTFPGWEAGVSTFMIWSNHAVSKSEIQSVRNRFGAWLRSTEGQQFLKDFDFPQRSTTMLTPETELKRLLQ